MIPNERCMIAISIQLFVYYTGAASLLNQFTNQNDNQLRINIVIDPITEIVNKYQSNLYHKNNSK